MPGGPDAKAINNDLDDAIEKNLDAALKAHRLEDVKYSVKNGVVTLSGEVHSQSSRARVADLARGVANVKQVVNDVQVTKQKASS
jgi:osmotically-inducible protein OsmY